MSKHMMADGQILKMESILDKAIQKMDAIERDI